MAETSEQDQSIINNLNAATGLNWHEYYSDFTAFIPKSTPKNEEDMTIKTMVAVYAKAARDCGAATEEDFKEGDMPSHFPVDIYNNLMRDTQSIFFSRKVATDSLFLAAIARDGFKEMMNNAIASAVAYDLKEKNIKKLQAVKRLNDVTGYDWVLRESDTDKEYGRYLLIVLTPLMSLQHCIKYYILLVKKLGDLMLLQHFWGDWSKVGLSKDMLPIPLFLGCYVFTPKKARQKGTLEKKG